MPRGLTESALVISVLLALTIGGVVAEVAGVVLALRDIRERRAALRAFDSTLYPVTAFAETRWSGAGVGEAPGEQPPLDARVAALEAAVGTLHQRIKDVADEAREDAQRRATRAAGEVRASLGAQVEAVRKLLLHVTRGTRRAAVGICLIVLGLALQAGANVIAIVAGS